MQEIFTTEDTENTEEKLELFSVLSAIFGLSPKFLEKGKGDREIMEIVRILQTAGRACAALQK